MNLITSFIGFREAYSIIWYLWHAQEAIRKLNLNELFYTKMMFYPYGVDLRFDIYFLYTIISYPIYLLFGPFAAYNFIIILTFVLTFWGMYLFLKLISKSQTAGIVGALMFTFSSYRLQRMMMGNLDLISTQGIGFFLYFGYKYFYFGKNRINLVGMTVVYLLQAYTDYRTFLILTFIGGYFMIGELYKSWIGKKLAETLKQLSSYFIIILISLLPLLSLYYSVVKFDFRTDQLDLSGHIKERPTDLVEFVIPLQNNALFLGWITIGLSVWYLFNATKKIDEKKLLKYWGVFTFIFFIFSLGPSVVIGGNVILDPPVMPFDILLNIPILKFLHVPRRFTLVIFFYLAIVVTFAYKKLKGKISKKFQMIFFLFMSVLIIVQNMIFIPIVVSSTEENVLLNMIKKGKEGTVLTFPFGNYDAFNRDTKYVQQKALLFQIYHQKPMLNGYITYQTDELSKKYKNHGILSKFIDCQEDRKCIDLTDEEKQELFQLYQLKYIYIDDSFRYSQIEQYFNKNYPKSEKVYFDEDILFVL